jgi:hypothetical protein
MNLEGVDQDLAAGAGRVGHGGSLFLSKWTSWDRSILCEGCQGGLFKSRHPITESQRGTGSPSNNKK